MPMPDATPTPPPDGLYGGRIEQVDKDFKEKVPDKDGGGFIIWKVEDVNGNQRWMPTDWIKPPAGISS